MITFVGKLPGLDSNQDKESQNPNIPRRKPLKISTLRIVPHAGRSAGRSSEAKEQQSEGGIADADLAALVTAWPTLPAPIRAAIKALVGTTIERK